MACKEKNRAKWSGYEYKTLVNPTPMSEGHGKKCLFGC
jgi:hypothetical protein